MTKYEVIMNGSELAVKIAEGCDPNGFNDLFGDCKSIEEVNKVSEDLLDDYPDLLDK